MYTTILASLLALAQAASTIDSASSGAVDISKVPQCALQCLVSAAGAATGCSSITDAYCLCTTGAQDVVKSLIPCICASTCTQQELVDTLTISNGICVSAFAAKGQTFNPPSPDPNLCAAYAGGAGTLPTPASGPATESSMSMPMSTSPAGYAPSTNMTPTTNETMTGTVTMSHSMTHSATHAATATGNASSNASNTSVPASSTGGAANVDTGLRMVGTAVLVGMFGAALATL